MNGTTVKLIQSAKENVYKDDAKRYNEDGLYQAGRGHGSAAHLNSDHCKTAKNELNNDEEGHAERP